MEKKQEFFFSFNFFFLNFHTVLLRFYFEILYKSLQPKRNPETQIMKVKLVLTLHLLLRDLIPLSKFLDSTEAHAEPFGKTLVT